MDTTPGHRTEFTRGRKRDHERTDAILGAAAELLLEVGFDKLRIQDVAERAGSGLGTIYRRWKTKEALVADAIRAAPGIEPPPSGDPQTDLANAVREKADFFAGHPDLIPGLIAALRTDDDIAAAIRERYSDAPFAKHFAAVLGSDHPQVELLAELVPAVLLHRTVFHGRPVDPEDFVHEVLAVVEALAG